jgi:hypothetical protein
LTKLSFNQLIIILLDVDVEEEEIVTFSEFVKKSFRSNNWKQDRLDYFFNSVDNQNKRNIIVNMEEKLPYTIDNENTVVNIDAIIAERENFSFFSSYARHQVFFSSNYNNKITRTEYGYRLFQKKNLHLDGNVLDGDLEIPVNFNKIPHFQILESNVFHRFQTYIFFPKLYERQCQLGQKSSYSNLDNGYCEEFIDDLFLKAAQSVLEIPIFNRLMKSFELAESTNISGKSNMFLTTLQLNKIVQKCREMIQEYLLDVQDPNLEDLDIGVFQDFFFVTATFGGKQDIDNFFYHADKMYNFSPLDHIDIAFDVVLKSENNENLIFFLRHGCTIVQEFISQMFNHQIDPNDVKWYKASLNTFGGFHHSSNNFKDYFIKFIGYSGLKNDFVLPHSKVKENLNIFTPDDLYRRNKTAYNKMVGTKYDIII